jgi:multimeric flavodoxin WrbA
MKIAVITGSPHRKGTSALLADQLILGARDAGHDVFRFVAAFEKVAPCTACNHCGPGVRKCVYDDSMDRLYPELLAADAIAFVTPLYYFGMSAQLKAVIDRFYANDSKLKGGKRAFLLATAYDALEVTEALQAHYGAILKYLGWADAGMLLATGCGTREAIERTEFPAMAYRMGKGILP